MSDRGHDVIEITGGAISTHKVEQVARHGAPVRLATSATERLRAGRQCLLDAMSDAQPHYGINTGFGGLGRIRIPEGQIQQLQVNLVRSHSTGVGDALPVPVVRAMLFVLASSLARGHSGVRGELVELLVSLLNAEITPVVPEVGSVGASGDLAPLAHVAQVLIGEGEAWHRGERMPAGAALQRAGCDPLRLEAKEGLSLINGTHLMAARGALVLQDWDRLFRAALCAAAMSVDACRATDSTLDPRVHAIRRQEGQIAVAAELRRLLEGSEILRSHRENDPRVQDPYSFRCCPAVLGAVRDAAHHVRQVIEAELSAVTDNPLVFEGDAGAQIVSGGNFHGLPLALALDSLAIAICHLAGIAERRIYHMLSGSDPEAELPTFLSPQAGLQSGLMIAQYTAAACCNEIIGLAVPASVSNLPTSAGMEDYNSFGPRSVAKAARAIDLATSVVAIELMCAATGLDHHRPLRSGARIEQAFATIRNEVPPLEADRSPAPDIAAIEAMIRRDAFCHPATDSSERR